MSAFIAPPDFARAFEVEKDIGEEDFVFFQGLLLDLAGILLTDKKRDLLKTRLGPYTRDKGFEDYTSYRKYLESIPKDHDEWQCLINLMTTNKTDFFREPAHFDYIEEVLIPAWIAAGKKEINIWSAASSSGEEPYTLAILLNNKLPSDMRFKILASDIDTQILNKAKNGVYSISKEHEIPESFRKTSIDYGKRDISEWFRIKQHLKNHITFQKHNLIEDSLPSEQMFDLVLCRNVMIYFPKDIVTEVANKLHRACLPEGYLFIGHSESLQGCKTPWVTTAPSVYKKITGHNKNKR